MIGLCYPWPKLATMNHSKQFHPTLPGIFQLPLKILPGRFQYHAIGRALNTLFAEPLCEGELDFLDQKKININIEDAGLHFCIYLRDQRLVVDQHRPYPDLSISGKVYAFLMLGTRKEDADTLFFRRQLKSEGDTELGLFVKNFLDGLEPQTLAAHRVLDRCMHQAIHLADATPEIINRLPGRIQRAMGA